ncbi:MAG: hypothetical protein U1E17_08410 [Geminicoccaceae bacterium]
MAQELMKAGIAVTVLRGGDGVPDGLELRGRPASPGHVTFSSHGDHRIFMALALFALSCERACGFGDSHDTADSFPASWPSWASRHRTAGGHRHRTCRCNRPAETHDRHRRTSSDKERTA